MLILIVSFILPSKRKLFGACRHFCLLSCLSTAVTTDAYEDMRTEADRLEAKHNPKWPLDKNAFLAVSSLQALRGKMFHLNLSFCILIITRCTFHHFISTVFFVDTNPTFLITVFVGNTFAECVRFNLIFNMENNRITFARPYL